MVVNEELPVILQYIKVAKIVKVHIRMSVLKLPKTPIGCTVHLL